MAEESVPPTHLDRCFLDSSVKVQRVPLDGLIPLRQLGRQQCQLPFSGSREGLGVGLLQHQAQAVRTVWGPAALRKRQANVHAARAALDRLGAGLEADAELLRLQGGGTGGRDEGVLFCFCGTGRSGGWSAEASSRTGIGEYTSLRHSPHSPCAHWDLGCAPRACTLCL